MEDIFWEAPYNSLLQDEYFLIKQNSSSIDFFKKQEILFNNTLRFIKDNKIKSGISSKNILSDSNSGLKNLYSLPIFSEESITDPKYTTLKNFNFFSNEISVDNTDDSYESSKYLNYLYYFNYKNLLNSSINTVQPISYLTVFDSFRSDYEDPFLYNDEFIGNESLSNNLNVINSDFNSNLKISNPFKLRSTVKNAIVTYNAIQKVFRSRFDEGRSNSRLEDFSNSFIKHPYITDNRINYESLLGKNKESFLKINFYNQIKKTNYSNYSPVFFSNNIYYMDLPFMVSMKSDPSRYLWFD